MLTKPDLVNEEDATSHWNDILAGKKYMLGHGYYVVRNNVDPNVGFAIARDQETEFFSNPNSVFSRPPLVAHNKRFGSRNLVKQLSKMLADEIRQR